MSVFLRLMATALLAALFAEGAVLAQTGAERAFVWEEVIQGNEEEFLRWPVAAALLPSGELAVADRWGNRVILFAEEAAGWLVARVIDLPGTPRGVVHDGSRLIVSLRGEAALVAVDLETGRLDTLPIPPGTVPDVMAPALDGGVWVFDWAGSRVLGLDASSRQKASVPIEDRVGALSASAGGGFYASFPEVGEVRRYGPEGQLIDSLVVPGVGGRPSWPSGLLAESGGEVLVVDRHNGRLLVLDASGRLLGTGSREGWESGLLRFPSGLARMDGDRVAVVDEGNGRVQIFRWTAR